MKQNLTRWMPILGVATAFVLLTISTFQYDGDIHWTRLTVSLLCAPTLPDGAQNLGRYLPIGGLLLLCGSMSLLFELVSRSADTRGQRKTIQIAGIGAMTYALLTVTPMHNLMVNIALAFFLVAIAAIVYMLCCKQLYVLAIAGIVCMVVKLVSVSLYYTNTCPDIWGVLQKLSFVLTTIWLFAVYLMVKPKMIATNEC